MSAIITIGNNKGGVGKTTTTLTLALGLAYRGYRVLMIDADAQGTLTRGGLGFDLAPGFYDLVIRDASYKDVILPIPPDVYSVDGQEPAGRAFLIPGNAETRNIPTVISDPRKILDSLTPLLDVVDFIFVDSSPTESQLHPMTYLASDAVLLPTVCEDWSLDGLYATTMYVQRAQNYRTGEGLPQIKILGIVPTMFKSGTIIHGDMLAIIKRDFGDVVWDTIGNRIAWAEAAVAKRPVFAYDPRSDVASEAWRLVDQFEAAMGVRV